jgi:hypothetical protein
MVFPMITHDDLDCRLYLSDALSFKTGAMGTRRWPEGITNFMMGSNINCDIMTWTVLRWPFTGHRAPGIIFPFRDYMHRVQEEISFLALHLLLLL